jgi:hypothetical protein
MTTMKDQLNQANPSTLATLLQEARIGDALRAQTVHLSKQAPVPSAASNYNVAGGTLDVIVLPDDAKCAFIMEANVRAGGSVGEFTPKSNRSYGATPTTTTYAITPCGDIAFLHATDAVTDADVVYVPEKGEVLEQTLPCVSGVVTLPATWVARGVKLLLEAEVMTGTLPGKKTILVPLAGGGAGLPATLTAQLTSNKSTVSFNSSTDGPTTCRVRCLVAWDAANDMNANLEAAAT